MRACRICSNNLFMATIKDLPESLLLKVLHAVPQACTTYPQHPETLLSLACVDKWFSTQLRHPSADVLWESVWSAWKLKRPAAAAVEEKKLGSSPTLNAKDTLRLAGFDGCMLCGTKPMRNVWWDFKIRCCTECLLKHEVPEPHLQRYFGLMPASVQHLPHRQVSMGSFTINTYWKAHLMSIFEQKHTTDIFEDYIVQQRNSDLVSGGPDQDNKDLQKTVKLQEKGEQIQKWCETGTFHHWN